MPLFKSHPEPPARARPRDPRPQRQHLLAQPPPLRFPEPIHNNNINNNTHNNRGFFGRRRSSDDSSLGNGRDTGSVRSGNSTRAGGAGGGGIFGGGNNHHFDLHKDPSVLAARTKLGIAEKAEVEADRALDAARAMVREAKDHIRVLEREAAEEHKRARAKQAIANDVSKSAAGLGRHGV
ncbi:hypothetical protein R3P38DRAFT_2794334 [Favolaschia claudopus]|uniref:Uncharacterized protein n=1 Tax=Favolaschia claudopus TaxID=2862362 RepID=A0AAW0AAA8_9AGAR